MPKALIFVMSLLLIGLSAAPAQARFFVGFGLGYPGFYRPFPVFYRPYLPPPPPPPVYVAPRPAYFVEPRPNVVERPVVYHSVSYRYSPPVVRHHHHAVTHRTCR
jgi:hypothetical protein